MKLNILLLLSFSFLCGCGMEQYQHQEISKVEDTRLLQIAWLNRYTELANKSTERNYGCISEMYSLAYHPVNNGPICKDACELMKQVNEMVAKAPPYIERPEQYALQESKVCQFKREKSTSVLLAH